MGQAESTDESTDTSIPIAKMQAKLSRHASELKQIATLSYEKFMESVEELNQITSSFSDPNGKQLIFSLKTGSENTGFLWKATVRVYCTKVNTNTGIAESSRLLDLKQYIHLYNEIRQQAALVQQGSDTVLAGASDISASILFTQLDKPKTPDEDSECVICMDRKAEIILSCSHSYCEQCIDEWNLTQKTCPICRAYVKGTDDTWVLTEKPDEAEMANQASSYVVSLGERSGRPMQEDT